MSDYAQLALPEPQAKLTPRRKTFRTHDGHHGNRLSIKAYITEDGIAWAESVSGVCLPTHQGATQIRAMMRILRLRMRGWAREQGATWGADGKDLTGGEWA